jgi:LPXTG-motif cell wall-anchored protein
MGKVFGRIIMMLCFTVLLGTAAQAKALKEVYLRDGGIIECQKLWQANGKVMVLVNRDTLVELARDEVDLKKTFGKKAVKGKKAKVKKKQMVATSGKSEAAAQRPAKPGAVPEAVKGAEPSAKPAAPVAKPAPLAQPQPAPAAAPPVLGVKPAAQPAPAAKPAAPAAQQLAAKPAPVQGTATSAKKAASVVAETPPRTTLPLAKPTPPPPPPKATFVASNMVNIVLGAVLVLLVAGYVFYKKRQKE